MVKNHEFEKTKALRCPPEVSWKMHSHLRPDEMRILKFQLKPKQLAVIHDNGQFVVEPSLFETNIGGTKPGIESLTTRCITKETRVAGRNFIVH